eukprot:TRINITY_DN18733_c0_g1_i1.p1 TRINITY_DN18733_c0_g1~~TRINITY_DN18733_c0_g1_i1.p1  ORF type:complete len:124 (-),score=23.64 TRINITY_DN18733_c0_g1_i1:281-652(-)
MAQIGRALRPALTRATLTWSPPTAPTSAATTPATQASASASAPVVASSGSVIQVPWELPPIFAGDRLVVYAFLPKDYATQPAIGGTLSARLGDKEIRFPIQLDLRAPKKESTVYRLAARARIK